MRSKYTEDDDNIDENPIDNIMNPTYDNEDNLTFEFEPIEAAISEADNWDHDAYGQ